MTLGSVLTLLGLSFDIWGVLLVFNEWQLAALPEQAKAHIETIQFFRNLRHRFTDEERAYHRDTVLQREIALSRIMGDAYETSFRQDNRDKYIKKGKILILIGFALQFSGALPLTAITWGDDAHRLADFITSQTGKMILAALGTSLVLSLPLISDRLRTAQQIRSCDKNFSGVWWSPFDSNSELLRMNIQSRKGKITGVINAREVDDSDTPFRERVPKYYHVQGDVEDGVAKIWVVEYAGTEPYASATASLTPEHGKLIWSLEPDPFIECLPKLEVLERIDTF